MSRFPKGQSGNPLGSSKGRRGRPPGQKPSTVVIWDLKMAARKHCPKALQRIAEWQTCCGARVGRQWAQAV
jgi:hypothetical protein